MRPPRRVAGYVVAAIRATNAPWAKPKPMLACITVCTQFGPLSQPPFPRLCAEDQTRSRTLCVTLATRPPSPDNWRATHSSWWPRDRSLAARVLPVHCPCHDYATRPNQFNLSLQTPPAIVSCASSCHAPNQSCLPHHAATSQATQYCQRLSSPPRASSCHRRTALHCSDRDTNRLTPGLDAQKSS